MILMQRIVERLKGKGGEKLKKQWGDEMVREREMLEKYKY